MRITFLAQRRSKRKPCHEHSSHAFPHRFPAAAHHLRSPSSLTSTLHSCSPPATSPAAIYAPHSRITSCADLATRRKIAAQRTKPEISRSSESDCVLEERERISAHLKHADHSRISAYSRSLPLGAEAVHDRALTRSGVGRRGRIVGYQVVRD